MTALFTLRPPRALPVWVPKLSGLFPECEEMYLMPGEKSGRLSYEDEAVRFRPPALGKRTLESGGIVEPHSPHTHSPQRRQTKT
jgi:hypothetical protein